MIHQRRHPEFVDGCFGCKAATVAFATVPGARKDGINQMSRLKRREKELFRYAEKRKAGEQPDNTTFEGMEAVERRQERWDRTEAVFSDANPPEVVSKLKKSYTNTE